MDMHETIIFLADTILQINCIKSITILIFYAKPIYDSIECSSLIIYGVFFLFCSWTIQADLHPSPQSLHRSYWLLPVVLCVNIFISLMVSNEETRVPTVFFYQNCTTILLFHLAILHFWNQNAAWSAPPCGGDAIWPDPNHNWGDYLSRPNSHK